MRDELSVLMLKHLPKNDGEQLMKTIADSYIEEGFNKGILQGIEKGTINTAINMLKEKIEINFIAKVTGLPTDTLLKLKNNN